MEGLGERERENVLNRLEHKKTNGLNPPPFPKALGFITKHVELVGTNRLHKHH